MYTLFSQINKVWGHFKYCSCLILVGAAAVVIGGCDAQPQNTATDSGKIKIFCSVPPLVNFIEQIGGDKVTVKSIIPNGRTMHDYSPTPREIAQLQQANIYFSMNIAFEQLIVSQLLADSGLKVIPIDQNILWLYSSHESEHHHSTPLPDNHSEEAAHDQIAKQAEAAHDHSMHSEAEHEASSNSLLTKDPHVWMALGNCSIMCKNIAEALGEYDPENKIFYQQNLAVLQQRINEQIDRSRQQLTAVKNRRFYVYHPAYGYFAHEFDLEECPIEIDGNAPSPRQIEVLRQNASLDNCKILFSQNPAQIRFLSSLAECLGARIVVADPMSEDILNVINQMCQDIAKAN